jgi:iron(III) transport system substrate-binding protein
MPATTPLREAARVLASLVALLTLLAGATGAAAQSDPTKAVYDAARREGTVVWYTSFPLDEATPLGEAFQKRYPGVKVEIVRGSGTRLIERFETEYRAGRAVADVITGAILDPVLAHKRQGWLMQWQPPEGARVPAQYKDEGFWYLEGITLSCMMYHPGRVKRAEVPPEPTGLTEPKWRGRIGSIPGFATGTALEFAYYVEYILGEKDFAKQLRELSPRMQTAQAQLVEQVIRGEIDIAFPIADYNLYRFKKQGAPVECSYPQSGVPANTRPVSIPKNAPHPNAAKLFLNWRLSEEGQRLMQEGFGMRSVREGMAPVEGLTPLAGLKVLVFDPAKVAAVREEITARWRAVFGQ